MVLTKFLIRSFSLVDNYFLEVKNIIKKTAVTFTDTTGAERICHNIGRKVFVDIPASARILEEALIDENTEYRVGHYNYFKW